MNDWNQIYRLCRGLAHSLKFGERRHWGADDLAHDTFIRIYRLNPEMKNPPSYIRRALIQGYLNVCKKDDIRPKKFLSLTDYTAKYDGSVEDAMPDYDGITLDDRIALLSAIGSLPEEMVIFGMDGALPLIGKAGNTEKSVRSKIRRMRKGYEMFRCPLNRNYP